MSHCGACPNRAMFGQMHLALGSRGCRHSGPCDIRAILPDDSPNCSVLSYL